MSATDKPALPTHLYHGTAASRLPSLLRHGLRPRGRKNGNWSEHQSRGDSVYLTTAYAPYFAMAAAEVGEDILLVEVALDRLDRGNLMPDEDFMEQVTRGKGDVQDIKARTASYRRRLPAFAAHWPESVLGLGTCCHRGRVPPEAITRTAVVQVRLQRGLSLSFLDPQISILNYQIIGGRYRALTKWIFDGEIDPYEYATGVPRQSLGAAGEAIFAGVIRASTPAFENREGITVTNHEGGKA